jgi:hypothetical protein
MTVINLPLLQQQETFGPEETLPASHEKLCKTEFILVLVLTAYKKFYGIWLLMMAGWKTSEEKHE